ncbi:MAG: peptidoglycan editing factor PgeF [Nitrosomonas sp.]|nr:peptidoglycan editing factor PgeF [Nitrosomonas sp.]
MNNWIVPDWPAPLNVKALFTTRNGGVSRGKDDVYATLNLGSHVNDSLSDVQKNRAILCQHVPSTPKWLKQVHGTTILCMDDEPTSLQGDAALSRTAGTVCAMMVADCLPVYLCDKAGTTVAVVHAGWRGLAAGIIEKTVAEMRQEQTEIMAWLGPAIGSESFEVGEEVRDVFVNHDKQSSAAFVPQQGKNSDKWLADIFQLARLRLADAGVTAVYGGGICTYSDPSRFFSYRRDGETGRMAALIWLSEP